MQRVKLTNDERKEKRRIAERIRMENIRKDPDKYALWQMKMRGSYLKRKKEGKIISVCDLRPKEQKIARNKSRESSKRWYDRKKLKERIQTEEEVIEEVNMETENMKNPLSLSPERIIEVSIPTRSTKSCSLISPTSVSARSLKVCSQKIFVPFSPKCRVMASVSDLPAGSTTMHSPMTPEPN